MWNELFRSIFRVLSRNVSAQDSEDAARPLWTCVYSMSFKKLHQGHIDSYLWISCP